MNLDPIIDYKTNFYYWIQAVCGWDTNSAEQKTYQYYIDKTINFSSSQKSILQSVSVILKKTTHPREVLAELYSGNVSNRDARYIKDISQPLQELFNVVWKQEIERLTYWKDTLTALDLSGLKSQLSSISKFLKSGFNMHTAVTIYLLINPPFAGSMGHVIRKNYFILLHPTGVEHKNIQQTTINTIIHEYIHLLEFESELTKESFKDAYDMFINPLDVNPPKGYNWKSIYSETIAYCFANNITGGYFRPETFHKPRPTVSEMQQGFDSLMASDTYTTNHLIAWIALCLLPDIELYLRSNKTIDSQFVAKMSELFLEYIVDKKK